MVRAARHSPLSSGTLTGNADPLVVLNHHWLRQRRARPAVAQVFLQLVENHLIREVREREGLQMTGYAVKKSDN